MKSSSKWCGGVAFVSLAATCLAAPLAWAQRMMPMGPAGFRVAPGLMNRGPGGAMGFGPGYGAMFNQQGMNNPYANMTAHATAAAFNYNRAMATMTSLSPGSSSASMYSMPNPFPPYPPYPYPPNPWNPYYPSYDPWSGYLMGSADVINAASQYMESQQQAYIMQEQARQGRVETRRRVFDQWLYERANTPTYQDERERIHRLEVRRSRNDPPVTEIFSAQALNALLANAMKMQSQNVQGADVRISEDMLRRINLSGGKGNVGLLKNDGRLSWPLALRTLPPENETGPIRQAFDRLLAEALDQVKNGPIDAGVLNELDKAIDRLREYLVKRVSDLPFSQYSEAKRFLGNLEEGVKALRDPNRKVTECLAGNHASKCRTVQDLVKYMADNGLQFASAVAGEEAAYLALHRALVAYEMSLNPQTALETTDPKPIRNP